MGRERTGRRPFAAAALGGALIVGAISSGATAGAQPPPTGARSANQTWQPAGEDHATSAAPTGVVGPAAAGDLDAAWSGDGVATVQTKYFPTGAGHGNNELAVGLYKDSDGQGRFRVWDFDTNGNPDPSWGGGLGYVLRTFRPGGVSFPTQTLPYDGGQIVVGSWNDGSVARLGITRLRSDGSYRSAGGYTGRTLYKVFAHEHDYLQAFSATVYGNGRVMVAVAAFDFNAAGDLVYVGQAVIRVNGVGSLDTTFSGDGVLPVAKDVGDIAFRSDGGTYMGRRVGTSHEIRKLRSNATYDGAFSGDGRALIPCGTHLGADLEADTSGRVVAACVQNGGGVITFRTARMTTAGVLDSSYSGNGLATLPAVMPNGDSDNWTIWFDPLGRFYAATTDRTTPRDLIVQSIDSGGAPNSDFSDDGVATVTLPSAVVLLQMTGTATRLFVLGGRLSTSYVDLVALEL